MGSTSSRVQYEVVDVLETVSGKEQESILVLDEESGQTYRWCVSPLSVFPPVVRFQAAGSCPSPSSGRLSLSCCCPTAAHSCR